VEWIGIGNLLMAHFAQIDQDGIVQQVIVVSNDVLTTDGVEDEATGRAFCQQLFGGEWVQTSYSGSFRKNFAGVGYRYDAVRDAFIPPQTFPSWTLDENSCRWQAPVPMPEDALYYWDEPTLSWVKFLDKAD
jgi:hypothetical protein